MTCCFNQLRRRDEQILDGFQYTLETKGIFDYQIFVGKYTGEYCITDASGEDITSTITVRVFDLVCAILMSTGIYRDGDVTCNGRVVTIRASGRTFPRTEGQGLLLSTAINDFLKNRLTRD